MYNVKNFDDALAVLTKNGVEPITSQCDSNIPLSKELACELVSEMTLFEKTEMLGGHWTLVQDFFATRRFYNAKPILGGGCKRLGIPSIKFSDGPRGVVVGSSTCFPTATARASSFDDQLEYEIGKAMARECISYGANYFAGICINLLRHPAWGRAQEAYGEDQFLLGRMGVALTKAMQEYGIVACPKHYALNSIENLRFDVDVTASDETMRDVYLPHFKACIDAGAGSIMGAYNKYKGDQACESTELLIDILRNEWGFKGFATSDFFWGVRDGVKSLKAGMDIEMPVNWKRGFGRLYRAVKSDKTLVPFVDQSAVDIVSTMLRFQAVYKKFSFGSDVVLCQEHLDLASKALEKGAVMLKNGSLPWTDKNEKIAIVGRFADTSNLGDHGSSNVHPPYADTVAGEMKKKYKNVKVANTSKISKCHKICADSDKILVVVGFSHKDEGEFVVNFNGNPIGGDRTSLRLHKGDVELINSLKKFNKPIAVIFFAGSATIIEEWKDNVDDIIYASYQGISGGRALTKIVCGDTNPSGKLPFTVAKDESEYPKFLYKSDKCLDIEYGYYHGYCHFEKENITPAYPFGFGLSYTKFEYDNVSVAKSDDGIVVSVDVRNIGDVVGDEIVQVYIGSNMTDKPKKLLKGYTRLSIDSGETKRADISVANADMQLYVSGQGWVLPEHITVYVGKSSSDTISQNFEI